MTIDVKISACGRGSVYCSVCPFKIGAAPVFKRETGMTIVSMLHLTDGIQYRLVGRSAEGHPTAEPARPSLEDGYVWLMKGTSEGGEGELMAVHFPSCAARPVATRFQRGPTV